MRVESSGVGIDRALYSTYLSYLPKNKFSYKLKCHADSRGSFVEVLKTSVNGQFSFFTANPGVTRGEHYHHTKSEKFLVLKGKAKFKFKNVLNNEKFSLIVSDSIPEVVETIPGWAHNIKNIGNETMIVMLWANEVFNSSIPDTIKFKV